MSNAPETYEVGGDEATAGLRALIESKTIRCVKVGGNTPCDRRSRSKTWDSTVVQCFLDGTDIGELLSQQGLACDCVRYSGGYYSMGGKGAPCPVGDKALRGCPVAKSKP